MEKEKWKMKWKMDHGHNEKLKIVLGSFSAEKSLSIVRALSSKLLALENTRGIAFVLLDWIASARK